MTNMQSAYTKHVKSTDSTGAHQHREREKLHFIFPKQCTAPLEDEENICEARKAQAPPSAFKS